MPISRRNWMVRTFVLGFALLSTFLLPHQIVAAQVEDGMPPLQAIDQTEGPLVVDDNHRIYNDSIVPDLPAQSRKADQKDDGQTQEGAGRGVRQASTDISEGLKLHPPAEAVACNDFNQSSLWASVATNAVLWRDSYAGWGAFAVDDGNFHKAQNVTISMERIIGPGNSAGGDQFSAKIASNQPYAAGFGRPLIAAPPGSTVTAAIKYMIFDHDTHGDDYDWVSLGIKPDATLTGASYVNGYSRGSWQTLSHTVTAGDTGQVMVLIQAEAPSALNSNIYVDDVQIAIDGVYLADCLHDSR